MKQTDRLLGYLKSHGHINPLESWSELGIYRLASRICDLRKEGWNIEKEMVSVKNKYGERVTFAEYTLAQDDPIAAWEAFNAEINRSRRYA